MKKWSNLDFLQVNAMSDELGEVTTIIDLVINFLAFGTQLLGLNKKAVQFCFTKLQNLVQKDFGFKTLCFRFKSLVKVVKLVFVNVTI